ncbi:MAG TPA: phosphoribosyl-AMP cyclohydrolase [Candidatus Bathyarchaeia archaeon]
MTEEDLANKLDWNKGKGLIPVVVQDTKSKAMLMLAYANKEALEKTLTTGYAHYWSRSRNKLWMKGETSGHTQKIERVVADCDYDALLYLVEQKGPVCHTGEDTCFHHKF